MQRYDNSRKRQSFPGLFSKKDASLPSIHYKLYTRAREEGVKEGRRGCDSIATDGTKGGGLQAFLSICKPCCTKNIPFYAVQIIYCIKRQAYHQSKPAAIIFYFLIASELGGRYDLCNGFHRSRGWRLNRNTSLPHDHI